MELFDTHFIQFGQVLAVSGRKMLVVTAARNEVSALGRKDDFCVRYSRRTNIFGVKRVAGGYITETNRKQ